MTQSNVVDLFVFDRLADWEIGILTAHLNSFEGQFLPSRYRVRTVGVSLDKVVTMGGLCVLPDATLDDVTPSADAMLVLPGGLGWERGNHSEALTLAQRIVEAGGKVAAICGATYGLALAGLLDDRAHTSNAKEYLRASGYRGGDHYREILAVSDRNVITANSTAALEFAREIFRSLDMYPQPVLDDWYGLFKTGEAQYFERLISELDGPRPRERPLV